MNRYETEEISKITEKRSPFTSVRYTDTCFCYLLCPLQRCFDVSIMRFQIFSLDMQATDDRQTTDKYDYSVHAHAR